GDATATVTVATFTHAGGVEPAGDFTATVDWGIAGHHADAATVTQPGGSGSSYTVTATRPQFNEEGSYTVTVTISEDAGNTSTTVNDGTLSVADAALSSTWADLTPPVATENAAFGPV